MTMAPKKLDSWAARDRYVDMCCSGNSADMTLDDYLDNHEIDRDYHERPTKFHAVPLIVIAETERSGSRYLVDRRAKDGEKPDFYSVADDTDLFGNPPHFRTRGDAQRVARRLTQQAASLTDDDWARRGL